MKVIAHDRVRQYGAGKNLSQLGNLALDPRFAVFKGFLQVLIPATKPRSAHTAGNAVVGSGVVDADDVFARLGHTGSFIRGLRFGCECLWCRLVGQI